MRDPRIGAVGATGLFLSLILRYAGLMALPQALIEKWRREGRLERELKRHIFDE